MAVALYLLLGSGWAVAQKTIQLLDFSDWHGQIVPFVDVASKNKTGGAAMLSGYINRDRAMYPGSTLLFTAGDAFGATPPAVAMFNETPAVLVLNAMNLSADALGNHNFDRGIENLARLMDVADYPFISANLANTATALPKLKRWVMFDVNETKVAVIGITNLNFVTVIPPGAAGPVTVTSDSAKAAMDARAEAAAAGAKAFVLLTHQGMLDDGKGPLLDFAKTLSGFDVIFGDHTDLHYEATINGALVIECESKTKEYVRVLLTFDTNGNLVKPLTASFTIPKHDGSVLADPKIEAIMAPFQASISGLLDLKVGEATAVFIQDRSERTKETALGNLIADAFRWNYKTDIGLVNGGAIRQALPSSHLVNLTTSGSLRRDINVSGPYDLVEGDVITVQPFNNELVVFTVTAPILFRTLEHSVAMYPAQSGGFAQVSGLKFEFDPNLPSGGRVFSVTMDSGEKVAADSANTYTVATNDFLLEGGDGYNFTGVDLTAVTTQGVDRTVLSDYIKYKKSITPIKEGRITPNNKTSSPTTAVPTTTKTTTTSTPVTSASSHSLATFACMFVLLWHVII